MAGRDVASGTGVGVAGWGVRGDGDAGLGQCGKCAADGLRPSLSHQIGEAQGGHGENQIFTIRVTNQRGDTARDMVMRNPLPDEVSQIPAGPVAELASVEGSAPSRLFSLEQKAFIAVGQVHG
jgi:hypothetical protein